MHDGDTVPSTNYMEVFIEVTLNVTTTVQGPHV